MFQKKTAPEKTDLDRVISNLLVDLINNRETESKEYALMVDNLVKLNGVKDVERPDKISYDTVATIVANLAGILVILNHERAGIVTSKALSFVSKLR